MCIYLLFFNFFLLKLVYSYSVTIKILYNEYYLIYIKYFKLKTFFFFFFISIFNKNNYNLKVLSINN